MSEILTQNYFSASLSEERDLMAELLADRRSHNTRRAYERDLREFFRGMTGTEPNPVMVAQFLNLPRAQALALVLKYKAGLIDRGLKEATVNRRLSAIKSLVNFARKFDRCEWSLEGIQSEKVQVHRDVTGVDIETFNKMLAIPNRATLKGARDYAILSLFWDNALRRNELAAANISDFNSTARTLEILGKGKGTQQETVSLSESAVTAVNSWLSMRQDKHLALFVHCVNSRPAGRITGDGLYKIVSAIAKSAGVERSFGCHRIRHSSITAALDLTNGDVRSVQGLSRHANLQTLIRYDDRRKGLQGKVSDLLSKARDS